MSYRENDNVPTILSEHNNKVSLALRFALEDIHRSSTAITPRLTGHLRADVKKSVIGKKGSIRWGKKYAAYQERGYTSGPVKKYTTPGTGAHFAEKSVKEVAKEFNKYIKKASL